METRRFLTSLAQPIINRKQVIRTQSCCHAHLPLLSYEAIQGLTLQRQKETLDDPTMKAATSQIINHQVASSFPFQLHNNLTNMLLRFQRTSPDEDKNTCIQNEDSALTESYVWIGLNGKPILLFEAQYTVLQYTHELTLWEPDNVVLWGKQYFCQLFLNIVQQIYSGCHMYLKYNAGNPLQSSHESLPLLADPFKIWQIDFIQMSPSQDYHLLLFVCPHTGFKHSHTEGL